MSNGKKKINLGIIFSNIDNWQGSINYFISLVSVLNLIKKKISIKKLCILLV